MCSPLSPIRFIQPRFYGESGVDSDTLATSGSRQETTVGDRVARPGAAAIPTVQSDQQAHTYPPEGMEEGIQVWAGAIPASRPVFVQRKEKP